MCESPIKHILKAANIYCIECGVVLDNRKISIARRHQNNGQERKLISFHQLSTGITYHWAPRSQQSKHDVSSRRSNIPSRAPCSFPDISITLRVGEPYTYTRNTCVVVLLIIPVNWLKYFVGFWIIWSGFCRYRVRWNSFLWSNCIYASVSVNVTIEQSRCWVKKPGWRTQRCAGYNSSYISKVCQIYYSVFNERLTKLPRIQEYWDKM